MWRPPLILAICDEMEFPQAGWNVQIYRQNRAKRRDQSEGKFRVAAVSAFYDIRSMGS